MRPRRSASSHKRGSHPVVAGGRGVAFVEHEVDDLEHRRRVRGASSAPRNLERDVRFGERASSRARSAARSSAPDEERARDLLRREAAEEPQRERDARLGGLSTGWQAVNTSRSRSSPTSSSIIDSMSGIGRVAVRLELDPIFVLVVHALVPSRSSSMARCFAVAMSHAPGFSGTPDSGQLSSADERVLRELFRETDVLHHAREPGDQAEATRIRQTAGRSRGGYRSPRIKRHSRCRGGNLSAIWITPARIGAPSPSAALHVGREVGASASGAPR